MCMCVMRKKDTLLCNLGRHKQQVPQDLLMPLLSVGKLSQPIPVLRYDQEMNWGLHHPSFVAFLPPLHYYCRKGG